MFMRFQFSVTFLSSPRDRCLADFALGSVAPSLDEIKYNLLTYIVVVVVAEAKWTSFAQSLQASVYCKYINSLMRSQELLNAITSFPYKVL